MVTQVDWAKLAAFVDGEGYIAITKKSRKQGQWNWQSFDISVRVANTDIRLPNWCKERFGGSVNIVYGKNYRHCSRPLYSWSVYGTSSRWILEGIAPHSVIKKEQIEIALAYLDTMKIGKEKYRKHRYVPEEVKLRREELFQQLKEVRNIKELPVN